MASSPLNQLPDSTCGTGPGSVPVFNCIVILRRDATTGRLHARVANLTGIDCEGTAERDVLMAITKRFKARVVEIHSAGQPIPWIDPPEEPQRGEQQRFVPVHL